MFERFTKRAREVVIAARAEATRRGDRAIGTEHLLFALADADIGGIAGDALNAAGVDAAVVAAGIGRHPTTGRRLSAEDAGALRTVGIDLDAVLARVEESFGPGALDAAVREPRGRRRTSRGLTPAARKSLELALREAIRLRDRYIGTEHLLLGIVRGGDGRGAAILTEAGVDLAALRGSVEQRLRGAA